jgi:hypothetical protein
VKRIQSNRDEPHRLGLANGDEHIPVGVGAARPDGVCLARTPVRVQAQEDVVTKDVPNRYEDWLPCPKRKLDERVEIIALESPNLDQLIPHHRADVIHAQATGVGCASGIAPERWVGPEASDSGIRYHRCS